jgi:uncharacterized membrane protein
VSADSFEWLPFLGRFHPLLVHLPIGFLVLLGALEALAWFPRQRHLLTASRTILVLSAVAAVLAAACGWLLAEGGDYDERLLRLHRFTGVAVAVAAVLLLALHARGWLSIYRVVLLGTVGLTGLASHWGGSLTHGGDYLTKYAPGFVRAMLGAGRPAGNSGRALPTDPLKQPAYAAIAEPILKQYCVACHGPEKSKGRLRLDSMEYILAGGADGKVVVPGHATDSELIKRLLLPEGNDDRMPPDGKPQPSPDDVVLLQWWIDAGVPGDKPVGELNPPEHVVAELKARQKRD